MGMLQCRILADWPSPCLHSRPSLETQRGLVFWGYVATPIVRMEVKTQNNLPLFFTILHEKLPTIAHCLAWSLVRQLSATLGLQLCPDLEGSPAPLFDGAVYEAAPPQSPV